MYICVNSYREDVCSPLRVNLMDGKQHRVKDWELLERLFEKRRHFERFALLYVHDPEIARDIMMDSFRYFMEHIGDIDTSGNIEGYMFKVVKNKCLDWLQRERIRQNVEDAIQRDAEFEVEMRIATLRAFDPDWLYDAELRARIDRALNRLPEKTRKIFMMSRRDSMSYQEISEALDISVKTVEFHISKALSILRNELGHLMTYLMILLSIGN